MVKALVRNLAKRLGYEVFGPPRAFANQRSLVGLLRREQINVVLDVGANTGQFATELRAWGYSGRIISFEPLAGAHTELCHKAGTDPGWIVAGRTAIGAETGSVEINVSGNSVSSSILGMLPSHAEAEPQSKYVGTEIVPVNRLDDLYTPKAADRVLLKIDVQGYEGQVLDGATAILNTSRAVILEMSLVPLYEGQMLASELWHVLASRGFEPWSLEPGFRHPETGRMMQLDGIFVRGDAN
jgi:FkbM family methyltransferase